MSDDPIFRSFNFRASETDDDGNTLVGLAVPFWEITRIDNWFEGTFDEQFAPGAFKRSLGMRTPVLQFDHGTHPMLGSMPLGHFERIQETKEGLDVRAPLFDNWLVDPVRDAIKTDAIPGMSIRFRPRKVETTDAESRDDGGEVELRTVTEAELFELGPVVFPQYESTKVDVRFNGGGDQDLEVLRVLAKALASGAAPIGDGSDQPNGPGTDSRAESPANESEQATGHSVSQPSRHRSRQRKLRLHQLAN